MFSVIRFFCISFFSLLVAAQILPEVGLGSAYQRLGLALENSEAVKVTYLLRAEKKSL